MPKAWRMTRKNGVGFFALAAIVLGVSGCSPPRGYDSHGNPIFHSIPIRDTVFGQWSVDVAYYTIKGNINNRNTSVFVSDTPSIAQLWEFALDKPSYNFIIHKNRVVSWLALLAVEKVEGKHKWTWFVTDDKGNGRRVATGLHAGLSQHRYLEMLGKMESGGTLPEKGILVPNHERIFYPVIYFSTISKDFEDNVMTKIESGEL